MLGGLVLNGEGGGAERGRGDRSDDGRFNARLADLSELAIYAHEGLIGSCRRLLKPKLFPSPYASHMFARYRSRVAM
jgi:hypothetical protein